MYDAQPPNLGGGQLYFVHNMLHDAASLTSITRKRSKQREGVPTYSKFYSCVKDSKHYPSTNEAMEEMELSTDLT